MSGMSFFFHCNYLPTQTPLDLSFRRSRFNWPSEISDPYGKEPIVAPSPIHASPLLKSKSGSKLNKNSSDLSHKGGELTHIPTIRVFEAMKVKKSDDRSFALLLYHCKTPPKS